jgi:hypothetical protein
MVLQNFPLDPAQRGTNGSKLRYHVDAVAVLLDHARKAADLAFDPAEPPQA